MYPQTKVLVLGFNGCNRYIIWKVAWSSSHTVRWYRLIVCGKWL